MLRVTTRLRECGKLMGLERERRSLSLFFSHKQSACDLPLLLSLIMESSIAVAFVADSDLIKRLDDTQNNYCPHLST